MPQISFIKYKDILEARRFDAEYFKPECLRVENLLKNLNSIKFGSILSKITGGATPLGAEYSTNGIHFLRVQNIMQNYFNDDLVFITEKQEFEIKRSRLKENDVLLTITGVSYGKSAVVEKRYNNANINQHSVLMRFNDKSFNPYFVSTFLNCYYGKTQSDKNVVGLSRPALDYNRIKDYFLIPLFPQSFQLQIEEIVKSAHQKQTESKQLYCEAEELLLKELGLLNYDVKHSLWFSTTKKEIENAKRYDSEYFQPKYNAIIKTIEEYEGGWDYVKNKFKQNTKLSIKVGEYCNYIEISDVNTSNGEISSNKVETKDIPANGKRKLFENDLLISKVRPYRGAVSFIDFNVDNLIGSGAFTVLQEKTNYKKEVLMIFLKTQFIKDLLLRYNCGTSYPVIKDEDILNLKIPLIKSEIQEEIAKKIQESYKLRKESKEHLEEAKRKVEEEIEK